MRRVRSAARTEASEDAPISTRPSAHRPGQARGDCRRPSGRTHSKEFELLRLFASNPGRVFPRKYLLEKIWDYSYEGYDRTIDSHINRLRAKIEDNPENPQMVLTVWGIGYKFSDEQR